MQQRYDFFKPNCFATWSNLQFNTIIMNVRQLAGLNVKR